MTFYLPSEAFFSQVMLVFVNSTIHPTTMPSYFNEALKNSMEVKLLQQLSVFGGQDW